MNRGTQIGTVLVALLVVAASSVAVMATPATLGATTDERIASNGNTADVQATNGSDNATASVSFANQTTNGSTVIVESVTVPEGGFVTIHTTSLLPPANETVGSVVGVSGYLAPGTHENVTVPLFERYGAEVPSDPARPDDRVGRLTENRTLIAMPHRDTNGNQVYEFVRSDGGTDGPYLNNSTAVTDDAAITVPQSSRPNATVAFDDQATDGATITIDSVTTTDGGFVAIHNASLLSGNIVGSVIGTTEYLEPGSHENVTVELFEVPGANFSRTQLRENATLIAMPHLDTNENQVYDFVRTDAELDGPYTANETTVIDRANVTDEDGAADGAAEPDDADARNDTVYYQVDFVVGEPIENFDTGGTYANDRLLRFVHGSTDDPVMRRAPGVLAYADAPELNERIESRDITVENGTATITFSIDDGESVRLSLVSYEKVGPGWSPATEDEQEFVDAETRTFESGMHTLTVELPGREAADETDAPDERADDADNATTLTVLSYNDIQTAAAKNESLPRLVELISERRQAHENPTVTVGGGDEVGPHALGPISQWRPPVAVLNHLDPTAEVIGNHEFDYGLAAVSNVTAASEFPWLATNLVNSSTGEAFDGTERYEIVEKDGIKVGIIGLVDQGATYGKTNINFSARGLTVRNYTQVGAETATMLEEERNVDVVIALAHTGISEAKTLARADDGDIDTIVVGDDEQYYPPQETSDTVITEARARAQFLGELNLTVEGGEVTGWEGRLLNVTNATPKNDTASSIIAEYRGVELPGTNVSFDEVIVRSKTPLDARFGSNYHHETGYGDLITDAMRAEADADVAITNAGGIRSDTVYGPGNITAGNIYNTLPFGNTLVTVELTGAELKRTLESQVVTLESETGSQLGAEISQQVSGVSFEWVAHTGTEEKIRDVTVNGEPLDPNATYEVAVNSFIADGGSGYPLADAPRVSETDTPIATIVIEYLQERDTIAPTPEGRMRRVDAALGNASVELDGEGTVEVAVDAPSDLTGVVPGTYVLSAGVNRTVTPDGAVYDRDTVAAEGAVYDEANGTVVVTVDDAALAELVRTENTTDLELYGSYNSSAYDRVYFNASRLNVNVNATTVEEQSSQQRVVRRPANAGLATERMAEV